jgi:hypothetical protein
MAMAIIGTRASVGASGAAADLPQPALLCNPRLLQTNADPAETAGNAALAFILDTRPAKKNASR